MRGTSKRWGPKQWHMSFRPQVFFSFLFVFLFTNNTFLSSGILQISLTTNARWRGHQQQTTTQQHLHPPLQAQHDDFNDGQGGTLHITPNDSIWHQSSPPPPPLLQMQVGGSGILFLLTLTAAAPSLAPSPSTCPEQYTSVQCVTWPGGRRYHVVGCGW